MSYEAKEDQEEEEDHEANLQFFLELAKPLALELPASEDRALAAAWVTRLEAEPRTDEEQRLRVDYLKLLLFVMQRGRLIGTFRNEPPEETLQPFPQGFGLTEMGNFLLEQAELHGNGDANATGVSYSVEISNDLKEFVAAQEIPNFGVHVYYAWSMEEPIHKWSSFDEKKFPQYVQDKIRQLKIINSEEKTHVPAWGAHPGNVSVRTSCDSSNYDKMKAKVKSPQEIEKSLERGSRSPSIPSVHGSPNDEDRSWSRGKKSRPSSRKSTPNGSVRNVDMNVAVLYSDESQNSEYDFDATGGMIEQNMGGCKCGHHNVRQKPETSKRLQKYENGGDNGGAYMRDMAGSGQRNSDRYEEMFSGNARCGGGLVDKERPICPAARFYQTNRIPMAQFMPMIKSRKTKCSSQDYVEDGGKKLNYNKLTSAKPCNATPSRPPCPCTCPREEKETRDASRPKKKPAEKTCPKVAKAPQSAVNTRRTMARDGVEEGLSCNVKGQYQMALDNVNTMEGCDCLDESNPSRHLEGLARLGLGKTTPDNCIIERKPSQQQQCPSGRRKGGERQEKTQPQEDAMPAPCLKTRPRIVGDQLCEANKKVNSCPPARTKPSKAYYPVTKPATEDYRGPPRFIQPEFDGAGKDEKQAGLLEAAMQHMISPCTPREFIDVLSSSSADEPCPDMEGQDEAGNQRSTGKYDEYAGENNDEDAGGGGGGGGICSSSSENAIPGGAGQDFDDYEGNECQKAAYRRRTYTGPRETQVGAQVPNCMSVQQHSMPCNLGNAPGPTPFNSPPPNYNQLGQTYQVDYSGGNQPCPAPYNSPNYNQPGQPYSVVYGGGNQLGQPHFNNLQAGYNQPGPGQFPMTYPTGNQSCPGPYNPPQATYNQMQRFSLPCGMGNQNPVYGAANGTYTIPANGQQLHQPNVYSASSRQRQNPDGRPSEGNRRRMSIDPGDFPLSYIDQYEMPATSTPCNTSQPPPPPRFLLSPILPSPGQQWSQPGGGMPSQRSRTTSEGPARCGVESRESEGPARCGGESMEREGPLRCGGESMDVPKEWVSLKGFRRSAKAKNCTRTTDLSSDTKRQMESDSTMQNELTSSSMSCQYGSYQESPKWRELPKSTRFPKKPADSTLEM